MKYGDTTEIETAFDRCLSRIPNVDLWRVYLDYLKGKFGSALSSPNNPQIQLSAVDTMKKAYESALDHVGFDMSSCSIWLEYTQIVKKSKTTLAPQDIQYIRSIYHKAICNPMHELDKIWNDYDTFENSYCNDPIQARANINDMQPKFKSTLSRLRHKKTVHDGLLLNMLARPPRNSEKEFQQKRIWKRIVAFEMEVTQGVEPEEVRQRVTFAFNQALLCLYHHPDVWIEAASYQQKINDLTTTAQFYQRAMEALPKNLLIFFSYTESEEKRKSFDLVKEIYQKFLSKTKDTLIYIHYSRFLRRNNLLVEARKVFFTYKDSASYHLFVSSALDEFHDSNQDFNRRVHVATEIFKLGLKNWINEPNFILEYLNFLEQINDKNNMRLLFEKVISSSSSNLNSNQDKLSNYLKVNQSKTTPANCMEIWNRFLNFEYENIGTDTSTISNLEKRREQQFPEQLKNTPGASDISSKINSLIYRLKFMDLWPCSSNDFDFMQTLYHSSLSDFSNSSGTLSLAPSVATLAQQQANFAKNQQRDQRGESNLSILNLINSGQNTSVLLQSLNPIGILSKPTELISKRVQISRPDLSKWSNINPNLIQLGTGGAGNVVGGYSSAFNAAGGFGMETMFSDPSFMPPAVASIIQWMSNLPPYFAGSLPELEYVVDTIRNCPIQVPLNFQSAIQPQNQNTISNEVPDMNANPLKRTRESSNLSNNNNNNNINNNNINNEDDGGSSHVIDDVYRERKLKKKKIG